MVTEPLEALIALLLISIILASIFIYNQRGTERLFLKRTLTRSLAGTVSGFYLNYLNSSQSFSDFNKSVSDFLSYIERRENVSCSAVLRLILKNGNPPYFDYTLVNHTSAEGKFSSVNEGMTVAYGNRSGSLHVYAIVNRSFISSEKGNPVGVYLVAYYDNGVPALYAEKLEVRVTYSPDGSPQLGSCSNFTKGIAICDIPAPKKDSTRTATITISYKIDGNDGSIPPLILDVKKTGYTASVMVNDTDEYGNRSLHYYLGDIVNLTSRVSSWRMENRKGEICIYNGPPSAQIPTGSNITCGNIPLPVFLVQGPINITLNYNGNIESQSRQVIFIDPYFTQIFVRTYFRG